MFRCFLILPILLTSLAGNSQETKSIEVSLHSRYDKHADYSTRYFDRSFTDQMKLWGISLGLHCSYLLPLARNMKLRFGGGYYALKIDKVRNSFRWYENMPSRPIDYTDPSGILPLFVTQQYKYNNIALSAGLRYEKAVAENISLTAGAAYQLLYTFSQKYRITYNDIRYKTSEGRKLGFGVDASFGVLSKFSKSKYYFNPQLIVPVCQRLNGDPRFGENTSVKMTKWLNGVGISFSIGRYL